MKAALEQAVVREQQKRDRVARAEEADTLTVFRGALAACSLFVTGTHRAYFQGRSVADL